MLTLFLALTALICPARAERPSPPRTGNLEFGGAYSYFDTSANYDLNGDRRNIPNAAGLSSNIGTLTGAYDLTRRWRLLASAEYASVGTTDGYFDRQNGAFTYVGSGGQYFLAHGKFTFVPEAFARAAMYRISETSDQVALSEGVNTLRVGGWAIYRAGQFQPFAYLGAEYRDAQRSSLGHYALGGRVKIEQFWAEASVRGFLSLTDDSDVSIVDRARRGAYLNRVNGGSLRYYGVNPSLHEAALDVGFVFAGFNIYTGGSYTLAGASTAQGWGAWGGVRFTLPTGHARVQRDLAPVAGDDGFEPTTDAYDPSLFDNQPNVRRAQPVRPAPRARPRPRRADPRLHQQNNLNRLLNETEQGLETQ